MGGPLWSLAVDRVLVKVVDSETLVRGACPAVRMGVWVGVGGGGVWHFWGMNKAVLTHSGGFQPPWGPAWPSCI